MTKPELHVISTGRQSIKELAIISANIHPFVDYIHLREKDKSAQELYDAVILLTKYDIPLSKIVINDRVDVAYSSKCIGVQLAYHSLDASIVKKEFPNLRVGCSVHSTDEALRAESMGADYVTYGHVFPTDSKPNLPPRGIEGLRQVTTSVNIPVIAIGGLTPENTDQVLQAGACGIAVLSGVLLAPNPVETVKQYTYNLSKWEG